MASDLQTALVEISELQDQIRRKRNQIHRLAVQECQRLINQAEIRPDELVFAIPPLKAKTSAAKYVGPNGEVWSGRGRQPEWLRLLVEAGHDLQEFRRVEE